MKVSYLKMRWDQWLRSIQGFRSAQTGHIQRIKLHHASILCPRWAASISSEHVVDWMKFEPSTVR